MTIACTRSIPRRLRGVASVALLAVLTNCLVASDGHDPDPVNGSASSVAAGTGGRSVATSTTGSSTTRGSAGAPPSGGSGGSGGSGQTCSGPTPAGARECGPGRTCTLDCSTHRGGCWSAGAGVEGSSCTSSEDCGTGLDCVAYSSTVMRCSTLCVTDIDCSAGFRCLGSLVCDDGSSAGKHCGRPCDDVTLAGATACGPGFKCDVGCGPAGPVTFCAVAGELRSGPCQNSLDCAAGFSCLEHQCRQACHVQADCTAGGTCSAQSSVCGSTPTGQHYCE
jgi:hypothetical protein